MTIEELQEHKEKLAGDIRFLLASFERHTGCLPRVTVDYDRVELIREDGKRIAEVHAQVSVEVVL